MQVKDIFIIETCRNETKPSIKKTYQSINSNLTNDFLLNCVVEFVFPNLKTVPFTHKKYFDRANKFAKACDIGIKLLHESDLNSELKNVSIKFTEQIKNLALNPEPEFIRTDSLASLENQFLISWNEGTGTHIEKFWKEMERENLYYNRKEIIKDVLKNKLIKNIFEFEHITDSLVMAQQENRISHDEAIQLSEYLNDFEKKKRYKL